MQGEQPMTDTEIAALIREYVELTDGSPADIAYITAIAENTIRFLLRRFTLVEKDAISNAYQQAIEQGKHAHVRCHVESRANVRLLESLFPEIAKETE